MSHSCRAMANEWPISANQTTCRTQRAMTHVAGLHADEALHLLLHGGDQFYADPVWKVIPALRRRLNRFFVANPSSRFDAATKRQVEHYFFQRYTELYAQPPVAQLLASVPSLMMSDDHDIYDGYGSHPPEWEESALHRRLRGRPTRVSSFSVRSRSRRRRVTAASRLTARTSAGATLSATSRSWRPTSGPLAGSNRSMSEAAWRDFEESLAKLHGCRTLLFISTVPIVNLDVGTLEPIFALLPPSVRFRSDLQDQWQSRAHLAEWQRMLRTLFDFSESRNVRIPYPVRRNPRRGRWRGAARRCDAVATGVVRHCPPASRAADGVATRLACFRRSAACRRHRTGDAAVSWRGAPLHRRAELARTSSVLRRTADRPLAFRTSLRTVGARLRLSVAGQMRLLVNSCPTIEQTSGSATSRVIPAFSRLS